MKEGAIMYRIRKQIPFLLLNFLMFLLAPLCIIDTGSAMLIILGIMPLISFVNGLAYGIKHGFHLLFPFLIALLFIPSIILYFNQTAIIYIPAYGIISLVGNMFGNMYHQKTKI